jgi:hypothetical protein
MGENKERVQNLYKNAEFPAEFSPSVTLVLNKIEYVFQI